jgi:hypothetical protein
VPEPSRQFVVGRGEEAVAVLVVLADEQHPGRVVALE